MTKRFTIIASALAVWFLFDLVSSSRWFLFSLFFVLPSGIAIAVIGVSTHSMIRYVSIIQVLLWILIVLTSLHALRILGIIVFTRAWPTYLPYYLIALTVPIVVFQTWVGNRHRRGRQSGQ